MAKMTMKKLLVKIMEFIGFYILFNYFS